MNASHRARWWRTGLFIVWLCGGLAAEKAETPQGPELPEDKLPQPRQIKPRPPLSEKEKKEEKKLEAEVLAGLPQPAPSILPKEMNQVDLPCVLRLAGINNPEILIARQRVLEAQAVRLLAMAQALPNLNGGGNYDAHTGPVQQSSGNILQVNRNAFYLGAGANAVAAGTVGIPGVWYFLNVSEGLFKFLAIRYNVQARRFDSLAVRNQMLLRVADAYMDLLRAEGRRAVAVQNQREAHEIARLTGVYARRGMGREADANRAAAELAQRNEDVVEAERQMLVASARLAELLNIPPSVQMHTIDERVVPIPLIPTTVPLHDLLLIALGGRPELAARRAEIREALMNLRSAQLLPFSPTVWAGFSAGTFGGGSNLVAQPGGFQGFQEPRFGSFAPRDDVDVIMFWTAQNAGLGNWANIRIRRTQQQMAQLQLVRELNIVRNDVAVAYAGIHARFAQMDIAERGVRAGYTAYQQDLETSTTGGPRVVLPIELLNSFRLTADARYAFLDAIVGYNKAQFAMYVALGQPPASALAKAIPPDPSTGASLVPTPVSAPPLPACVGPDGKSCIPPPGPVLGPVAGDALVPDKQAAPAADKQAAPAAPRTAP
jgi:outer membrane protein TolC